MSRPQANFSKIEILRFARNAENPSHFVWKIQASKMEKVTKKYETSTHGKKYDKILRINVVLPMVSFLSRGPFPYLSVI